MVGIEQVCTGGLWSLIILFRLHLTDILVERYDIFNDLGHAGFDVSRVFSIDVDVIFIVDEVNLEHEL